MKTTTSLLVCCALLPNLLLGQAPDSVYLEEEGLLVIELEDAAPAEGWRLMNMPGQMGTGVLWYDGPDSFSEPGKNLISFPIRIQHAGTYRFRWRSTIGLGHDQTLYNDNWLRFPGAEMFGVKGEGKVYPMGVGKEPTPKGKSKDGWFKVYGSKVGAWQWECFTSDHDAHAIYVTFPEPGVYELQISGRSFGHVIDRMVLYQEEGELSHEEEALNGSDVPANKLVPIN